MPDTYNINAIRGLLQAVFFQQEHRLARFCQHELGAALPEGLPFLWNIELTLLRCQAADDCERLLERLKALDEGQYARHTAAIQNVTAQPPEPSSGERLTCIITFRKPKDFSAWSPEVQAAAARAVAAVVEHPPASVTCADVSDDDRQSAGPVKLTFEMPETAFERLLALGQQEDDALTGLGIIQIKEQVRQPHNLANIRRMLDKMFTVPQLHEFCTRHFPAVAEAVAAAPAKAAKIDQLIAHAHAAARIPHILVFAKQQNAKIYERCEPYYYPPRIYPTPQQHAARRRAETTALRQPILHLTWRESITALLACTVVAMALTFLVKRVLLIPIQDQDAAQILNLLWGTFALFGIAVSRAALWAANRNRGPLLAGIAVAGYWLGMVFGNALAYLSVIGIGFHPAILLPLLALGVQETLSPLFSFGAPLLVVIIGTYWAYHYTR